MTIRQIRMLSPLLLAKSFAVYCSGQKLVLSRTRLVGLGQALCMTASPERASHAGCDPLLPQDGKTDVRTVQVFQTGFEADTEFEFFRHPAAGGSSAQRGEVLT